MPNLPVKIDLTDFINQYSTQYDLPNDNYRRPPFAMPTKAGKSTPIYSAHPYHTKVPPQGIEPYIAHYTNPHDLVLDPFCGSGMTGVATLKLGRNIILSDLSPAAVHIASNYCQPIEIDLVRKEHDRIIENINTEFESLYGINCNRCGGKAIIQYTIWSDVYECDKCGGEIILWNEAVDKSTGKFSEEFNCPKCGKSHKKLGLKRLSEIPVKTSVFCKACNPNQEIHPTTVDELKLIQNIQNIAIPYWVPSTKFDISGPQYRRNALSNRKILQVTDLYTHRNLWALARLWKEAGEASSPLIISALKFIATSIALRASRLNRLRPSGAGDPMSGTIYISSITREDNVFDIWERKFKKFLELKKEQIKGNSFIAVASATNLEIPDQTIDYIFTDPPFGSNIYYSEVNLVWESWLDNFTDTTNEAVVHRKQDGGSKRLKDYSNLMSMSFNEMFRVLKPGRWASVVFHNSDDQIWQSILDAIEKSGFELAEVNAFDKEQITFKGNRGAKGLERVTNKDIVLNLRKPSLVNSRQNNNENSIRNGHAEERIVQQIVDFLSTNPPIEQRTLQHFWNVVLYDMLTSGLVDVSMEKVGNMLPFYFKQVDGRWYLRGEAVVGGNVFDLKTDLGAISWLSAVLSTLPQTTGDLIPRWQETTAASGLARDVDPGRMERLLGQNFWLDKRTNRWRIPTEIERRQMSAAEDITAEVHLRVIRRFLEGEGTQIPSARELGAWIQFAYHRKAYAEAVGIYKHIDESQLESDYVHLLRKMVHVSRIKAGKM